MVQMTVAMGILPSISTVLLAAGLVVGPVAFVSTPAVGAERIEADEARPASGPDFRFEQPRWIIGLRGGWAFNRSEGEIYDFLTQQLILDHSDFDAPAISLDVSVRVLAWLDVVLGFEASTNSTDSESRAFVDQFGNSIEQKTRLSQVPLFTSLKLYPFGRGRQVGSYAWVRSTLVTYVGGGIGGTWYELKQKGDFVDFVDFTIFEGKLRSDGWAFAGHVFAGIDLKLTRNFGLVVEGRYYWAHADVGGDFIGFDPIDLDGARVMVGISWRL